MDASTFCCITGGGTVGIILGWLISSLRMRHKILVLVANSNVYQKEVTQFQQEQQALIKLQQCEKDQILSMLHTHLKATQEKLHQKYLWHDECIQLTKQLCELRAVNILQEAKIREVTVRLEDTQLDMKEKQLLMINNEKLFNTHFENLAHRIFEHTGKRVEEQNTQSLNILLIPLREQLKHFSRQVQDSFGQEARERHTLTHEIRNLQQLNSQMTHEAINLTKALKGNNKTQGIWGEIVLNRVLESSGLREGHEYQTQVNIQIGTDSRMQPDIIVHLPQGKDVVIDSKVSLVAYERYFNTEDEVVRELALQEHLVSVKNHIRQLGCKDYEKLPGIKSLDYILMFIPIEPAFLVAINCDSNLLNKALKHNIMLVSPTTLLVALRTISNLWRYEHQNQNAQKIADRASKLYDKMRLFIDDMESLGHSIDKAQLNYNQAMKKFGQGRGNLIGQVENFRVLGVEVKRPISFSLVEKAHLSNELEEE
ncbi:DNA recombination protein RmuC [Candidatus Profftia sp. (ex Adelges kitamiensis)]|uniref:DNA recombination protein RmuC n=1 Tax=Candidatus Profftia sp. (ex Adelges kitamiensis) TaxID=2864218 RepID=UPI001CE2B967|nr:DNA recombination protein RmuC [Candidatus Profftia sp. (ex Adelges kitamiensis)]